MNVRAVVVGGVLLVLCGSAMAQQPYAGMDARAIKSLSDQQVADLQAGRGMGFALAAELNGYPGPMHAIELKDKIGLSAEQVARLQGLFSAMKAEAIPIGATLIEQERALNDDFAKRTITPARLETSTQQIGATQATLRASHLKYHLATVAILTPAQVARYGELRGYGATQTAPMRHHHQQHR